MSYDAPPDWLDRELVLNFFWTFSVFECALKREGFLMSGWRDAVKPDWERFGKQIRGRFGEVRRDGFDSAVRTLLEASPRKQVVREGQLEWAPVDRRDGDSDEEYVLYLVKTVRNNLFHGGKYPDGSIKEVARDKKILEAALAVLRGCYELHPSIARRAREAREAA